MLFTAIDTIRSELVADGINAELGNVSEVASSGDSGTNADIIISLINIEENRISRDPQNFIRREAGILKKNPAVHLYLTLLFTSIKNNSGYGLSLQNITRVIQFFQKKYVFDHTNTNNLSAGIEKLVLEMNSLTFEQLNQLWSIIGNKYQPSVVYRMRMVTVDSVTDQAGALIKEIEMQFNLK